MPPLPYQLVPLGAIDSLVGLLIFVVISLIAGWLQKKQRQEREGEETPPPPVPRRQGPGRPPAPAPQAPSPQPLSWEEELKRLLEGQAAEAPPPPPPPPPVIVQSRRPVHPPPLPLRPEPVAQTTPGPEFTPLDVEFKPLATLSEASGTYERATAIDSSVHQQLGGMVHKPLGLTKVESRSLSHEAAEALALLRRPQSARSAILASVILGTPRGLS